MKLTSSAFLLVSLFAVGFGGCALESAQNAEGEEEVVDETDGALSSNPSNIGYYVVTRHDMRKCMSPVCGGYYVKRVNADKTVCADGTKQAECYMSAVEVKGLGLSEREASDFLGTVLNGQSIIKAKIYRKLFNGVPYGTLKASEGWLGATGSKAEGTFYRAADNGTRCIKAPCPSTTAYTLNDNDTQNVIGVVLNNTATPADEESLARANAALGTKQGVLVAGGVMMPKCMANATDCGPKVIASEFYLRVTASEGKACGGRGMASCGKGQFCSWKAGDMCGAADAPGTCQYKPEMCTMVYKPVCACNGKTYSNECAASAAGQSVSTAGKCP